ncbi:hypothetical protein DMB38_17850 [Streptomyces sp. WAC 06738]|uniref:hypothetical protein n=1 Tax=Streptomyces sp. WAC 06738 TaxID=2203210 RepID=UPI000F6B7C3F|nr:hypothetical protein [Streptomyces sp. WAC 06738]AZM47411.1 hypothetical protein DMB38_17850 [Streptomyces sp. WAC 06738]
MPGLTEAEEARLRRALGLIAAEAESGAGAPGAGESSESGAPGASSESAAAAAEAAEAEAAGGDWGWAEPAPGVRRVRGARRALAVVVSAAAVVAFCLLAYTTISGAGTDRIAKDDAGAGAAEDAGGDAGGDADGKGLSRLENAACTKRLLEGTVADVQQVPHPPDAFPWVEVTLTDVRWHVPPSTEKRVTVRLPDPVEWNDEKPFARGELLLVEDLGREAISYFRDGEGEGPGLETVRGERLRALNRAQEEGVRCPSYFVNGEG